MRISTNILILFVLLIVVVIGGYSLPGYIESQRMAVLTIDADPGGIDIYINGEFKGTSPRDVEKTFDIKVEAGKYRIEGKKDLGGAKELYDLVDNVVVTQGSRQTIKVWTTKRDSQAFKDMLAEKYENGLPIPKMVKIPAGSFMMGCERNDPDECGASELPLHRVDISAFEMGETEITYEQWDACVLDGGCNYRRDEGMGRGNRPIFNISWNHAQRYIRWLNSKTSGNYRLPTEAEWEYAARAGTTTQFSWGDELGRYNASCEDCGDKQTWRKTQPVASFKPNAFGLYDMHGNLSEWVSDWYDKKYYAVSERSNPKGPSDGKYRVIRGGSYYFDAWYIRSACRGISSPDSDMSTIGFRIAR